VDYVTLNIAKSDDNKQLLAVETLTWLSGTAQSHGTFTIDAGENFEVDIALSNTTAHKTGTVNGTVVPEWDGKSLTKKGEGTLVLSASISCTGTTTIAAGALLFNGTSSGQGAYIIKDGAALGGYGTIATSNTNITLEAGGKIDLTLATPTASTLTLNLGTGSLNINAVTPGSLRFGLFEDGVSDQVLLQTTATLIASGLGIDAFAFTLGDGVADGNTYTLISNVGTTSLMRATLGSNITGIIGEGYEGTLALENNDLVLHVLAIPEPGTWAMMLGGLGILVLRRQRRTWRSVG
jgi:autotransporter-associated beta strand protein